jgi:pilus assembly protein CpaB
MRVSNVVMIVIALFCATAAALLTRTWLVSQSARAPAPAETAVPLQSVMVASRDLKYGDKLTADGFKSVQWPASSVPKGAFTSGEALLGGAASRAVLVAIAEGEPILDHKLLGGSTRALSGKLSENMKAVTIRVNDVAGVAGFVQPDDRVDVFLTYGGQISNEGAPKGASTSTVVVLLQNIRVLAVDQVTERKDLPTPAKAVTLEATTEEAQKLVLAGRVGELSLALNRIAEQAGAETNGAIAFEDLLAAERTADKKPTPGGPVVTVTRSVERKDYHVQPDKGKDDTSWQTELLSHQGSRSAPQR